MKVRRRWVMCVLVVVVMGGIGVAWLRHTPEPSYEGVRFSVLLDGGLQGHESWRLAHKGTKELGAAVVPYLASQFDDDPLRKLAPGTEYEERARKLLLNVTAEMRHERDLTTRRMAYHLLGSFPSSEVTAVLMAGMNEHGVKNASIQSLVKLGTNAIPALKKVAEKEEGHVRPATLVLEKIEKQLAGSQSNEPTSGEWPFRAAEKG